MSLEIVKQSSPEMRMSLEIVKQSSPEMRMSLQITVSFYLLSSTSVALVFDLADIQNTFTSNRGQELLHMLLVLFLDILCSTRK